VEKDCLHPTTKEASVDDRERASDFLVGYGYTPADEIGLTALAAEFAAVRREAREECAKEIDELDHDFQDDTEGFRQHAVAAIRAMNEEGVIAAVKPKPRYEAVANAVWDTKENRAVHKDELIALLNEKGKP
jgi:imidazolonepropionase-like amidohydrolase